MNLRLRSIAIVALATLALFCGLIGGCQSGGEPKEDAPPVKKAPTGPKVTGALESQPISGLGFQRAVLSLDVKPSGEVSGVFRGGYEDKAFEVYVTGEVSPDGALSAQGEGSDGTIRVEGPLETRGFSGEVAGEIFTEEFSLPLAADPVSS